MGSRNLRDILSDEMSQLIQEEIDWEIMCEMLKVSGWKKVTITSNSVDIRMAEHEAQELKEWCRNNLIGNYKGRGKDWMFKEEKDAMMFSLRWS